MTFEIWIGMLIVAVVSVMLGTVFGSIIGSKLTWTVAVWCLGDDATALEEIRADGMNITVTIDATAPGATHGARGMGNTIAEAVASLREQLEKLETGDNP